MQFNSYIFLLFFFPTSILVYYGLIKASHNLSRVLLIILSALFYVYSGWNNFIVLFASIIVNYSIIIIVYKIAIRKKLLSKLVLWIGIIFNCGLLIYYKYLNFIFTNIYNLILSKQFNAFEIVLPLGISFITFQQIAYLVDVYHQEIKPSFIDYCLYILYFPKLLMGPITLPGELIPQFHDKTKLKINTDNIVKGLRMFTIGLFKKVIIADTFATAANWGYEFFGYTTSADLWIAFFAYSFQIYFDFSGYSDMAIGTSLCFNIELPINFDSPYKATSFRDFWKRWHISLTKFFTKYIYIPLGGNRQGKLKTIRNTIIVFFISGIWHGANWTFMLWGFLHGIGSVIDRLISKYYKKIYLIIQRVITFLSVTILWWLFRSGSIADFINRMLSMLKFKSFELNDAIKQAFIHPEQNIVNKSMNILGLKQINDYFWLVVFFGFAVIGCLCFENTYKRKYKNTTISALLTAVLLLFSLTCLSSESVFIYNGF